MNTEGSGTGGHHKGGASDADARLLEQVLDGTLVGEARERALARIARSRELRAEAMSMSGLVAGLRETPGVARRGPDLTGSVLAEVDRRRGFVPAGTRRAMPWLRGSLAACGLLGLLGVTVAQARFGVFGLRDRPAPLTEVSSAVNEGYNESADAMVDAARVLRASIVPLPRGLEEGDAGSLALSAGLNARPSDAGDARLGGSTLEIVVRREVGAADLPGWSADLFAGERALGSDRRSREGDASNTLP